MQKDIVKISNSILYLQFSNTGDQKRLSTHKLENVRFYVQGDKLYSGDEDKGGILIESFSKDNLANNAFDHISSKLRRYFLLCQITRFYKGIVKWLLAPLLAFVFAMSLNFIMTSSMTPYNVVNNPSRYNTSNIASPAPAVASETIVQSVPVTPSQPVATVPPASELAKALASAVDSHQFSIQISNGEKGEFYVFSDPLCSHCKNLETQLELLQNDYTIHIFPVSIIGGQTSEEIIAKILCSNEQDRPGLWRAVINGSSVTGNTCEIGEKALDANNQIFRIMQFKGTPTIINSIGVAKPLNISSNADSIQRWLSNN